MRPVWAGWLLVVSGCVLPDYHTTVEPATSGDILATQPLLSGADATCGECLKTQCSSQRADCGDACADLQWPVSPAWTVTDEADPFASCVIDECADACNARWGCVQKYELPTPGSPYEIHLQFNDAVHPEITRADVKVHACQARDASCSAGGGAEQTVTSDADGNATLTVASAFFGYFLIDAGADYFPVTAFWSQPVYRVARTFEVSLFPRAWLAGLAKAVNVPVDEEAGHVVFRAENCSPLRYLDKYAAADGVVVSLDEKGPNTVGSVYATYGLTLDPAATATKRGGGGYGGAFNVPEGLQSLRGTFEDSEVANASVPLRPDTLAMVFLVPNAR